jgi:NitT/TauT family transport system permease protein
VGLSEKWSRLLEPFIQVGASFPATLLFPIAILLFEAAGFPLGIGSVFLMLMGSFWYIFLNVIAGARAMPSDLREVAANFTFNRRQRFFFLNLPAVFPYLVTGLVTASGGAWNASIVSEYVSYKNQILTTPGIGSSISLAAQNNDMPLLAASIVVLVVVVVIINLAVWLRLYHYSEKRFAINA